jgi:hypothetical protein
MLEMLLGKFKQIPLYRPNSKYSIERLEAFHDYHTSTSGFWLFMVTFLTPLPSLIAMTALNYIPLQPPEDGWKANYGFWIRVVIDVTTVSLSLMFPIRYFVDGAEIRWSFKIFIMCLNTMLYIGLYMIFAEMFFFPVPFGMLIPLAPTMASFLLQVYFTLKYEHKKKEQATGQPAPENTFKTLQTYVKEMLFILVLLFIYPFFAVGFEKLSYNVYYQALYTIFLPILKKTMSMAIKKLTHELEDLVIENAVFTVHFFNALFVSICLGGTSSIETTTALICIDLGNQFYSFLRLRSRLKKIEQRGTDLVAESLEIVEKHQDLIEKKCPDIRWKATNGLSFRRADLISKIVSFAPRHVVAPTGNARRVQPHRVDKPHQKKPYLQTLGEDVPAKTSTETASQEKMTIVRETLSLLCEMEQIVLVEYVESVIPFMYGLYQVGAFYSGNKIYLKGIDTITEADLKKSLTNIFIYGSLEFASLILLYFWIRRQYRINILYLIAFVLETHFISIQSKLYMFFNLILHFPLKHFGVDFTFQFDWLPKTP